jgi:GDPmannose 4,6-dehydratase
MLIHRRDRARTLFEQAARASMSARALITGIGGQDGSLLAEHLLQERYEVLGVTRDGRAGENLREIADQIELVHVDLLDGPAVRSLLSSRRPTEVYNLASPSFSPASWEDPVATVGSVAGGVAVLLEAIREVDPSIRLFQASSSEMFGQPAESPQSEATTIQPVTPYGAAKACGHFLVRGYRLRYGLFACSGILYNHESSRRPLHFLPRKVASGAAAIALGLQNELQLGNLDAERDWGSAADFVKAAWLTLQHADADDYVIATGEVHSVEELVACAFGRAGLDWTRYVQTDPGLARGTDERRGVVGNPAKAKEALGWRPTVTFEEMIHGLVDDELRRLEPAGTEPGVGLR